MAAPESLVELGREHAAPSRNARIGRTHAVNQRQSFFSIDVILILCVLGLMSLGIAFIYSSGVTSDGVQVSTEWIRQIIWAVTGIGLMIIFSVIDYQLWNQWAVWFYLIILLLLGLVLIAGKLVNGARAWLGIGPVGIQPSEFGKLALILVLSWWFSRRNQSHLRLWAGGILLTIIPVGLILAQPDLGTAFVYIPVLLGVAFVSGIQWKLLFFPVMAGIITAAGVLGFAWNEYISPGSSGFYRLFTEARIIRVVLPFMGLLILLIFLGWLFFRRRWYLNFVYVFGILIVSYLGIAGACRALQGYQMMRLVVFLDPQTDPRGAGWHIIQSVTAIGSGGSTGKGFLQGTQSHYRYLPEQSTDFIFSILAEETGFVGSMLVFALFSLVIIRAVNIARTSQDHFGTCIAAGIAAMIGYHVIQNIGMAIGVMPITGIPLFFLSYGGSSLWTALMCIGLLLSIHSRRYRN